ncbi:hypothetical protein ACOI1C_21250 [Bacillus sp. DJP31]|uniref:hypothetical protein n=1 Tax=Bacillus sp. DJP31 TaxID=3409789 RepID=UPI003BB7B070
MEQVSLMYKYREILNGMDIVHYNEAYKVNENYIVAFEDEIVICIDTITAETDNGVYIDGDAKKEKSIYITLENTNSIIY